MNTQTEDESEVCEEAGEVSAEESAGLCKYCCMLPKE